MRHKGGEDEQNKEDEEANEDGTEAFERGGTGRGDQEGWGSEIVKDG